MNTLRATKFANISQWPSHYTQHISIWIKSCPKKPRITNKALMKGHRVKVRSALYPTNHQDQQRETLLTNYTHSRDEDWSDTAPWRVNSNHYHGGLFIRTGSGHGQGQMSFKGDGHWSKERFSVVSSVSAVCCCFLLLFYFLATSMVISGQVPTCGSVDL